MQQELCCFSFLLLQKGAEGTIRNWGTLWDWYYKRAEKLNVSEPWEDIGKDAIEYKSEKKISLDHIDKRA